MKRKISFFFAILCFSLGSFAQETSMEIDCQNPGWLSYLITYGNQKTIQNLKVTGYINSDDLKFIGEMMSKQSLKGCIDLEGVNIVGVTTDDDDVMPENSFNIKWSNNYPNGLQISHIKFPLSIKKSNCSLSSYIKVDTITIGGKYMPSVDGKQIYETIYTMDGISVNERVKHLVLREGVTDIPNEAFHNNHSHTYYASKSECVFNSITFPTTIKTIGKNAFRYNYALAKINLPDGLESIEQFAFTETSFTPDTLVLPNSLKSYHTSAFSKSSVIYFGSNITDIINNTQDKHDAITSTNKIVIHIAAINPPKFSYYSENCLKGCTIYVPKSSLELYKTASAWKNATIMAEPVNATSIEISQKEATIIKNNTLQLTATILPYDADSREIIWSSSNPDVASVSSTGLVSGINSGTATIFATSVDNKEISTSCVINVYQPVTSIQLNTREKKLNVGETYTLTTTINPYDADNKKIIWSSSNPEIASVENGTIVAHKSGTAIITALSDDNDGISDCCEVVVTQPVTGVTIDCSEYTLKGIGTTIQLNATIEPEDASNKEVNWESSNESICHVSNGKVVAVGLGTCVIIATSVDGAFMTTCTINVIQPVSGISLNYETYSITRIGQTLQLIATITPDNATNKEIVWESSNENVCSVSNGIVTAIANGTTIIKATSVDGEYTAECIITVENEMTGIETLLNSSSPYKIYDVNGNLINCLKRGVNIIRYSNGTIFKVLK